MSTVEDVVKSLPVEHQKVIQQIIEQSKKQEHGWIFVRY